MTAREIKRSDKLIALGLALCATVMAVLALAAPANAETYSNGYQLARFKVEVKGWQKSVQQHHHQAENECDVDDFSSGSESVVFKSKPFVIMASYFPGQHNPEFFAGKRLGIPTTAKIKRSFTPRISFPYPDAQCGENGGGVDPGPGPDCGTRTIKPFDVKLGWGVGKRDEDTLVLNTDYSGEEPYERCPGLAEGGFPFLIVFNAKNDYIGAQISQKELFDPKFQKWISIANGSRKERSGDYWYKTTLHWEVSFTRLKNKVPGA